jgi:plasmid stabilization system protein ParE
MTIRWSEQAALRLADVEEHLWRANPKAAAEIVDRLVGRASALERFPEVGRLVPDLPGSSFRELIEWPYRIVYRVRGSVIEIVTVFDGRRLLPQGDLGGRV